MKSGLKRIIVDQQDSVRFYILPYHNVMTIETIGKKIPEFCQII